MRKLVVLMQTTLDGRIAGADGGFWEPFPWGEEETAYVNGCFRAADTWAMSRPLYDVVVPWWEQVARGELPADAPSLGAADHEFAAILAGLQKVVFSRSLATSAERIVLSGDLAPQLAALKAGEGRDIVLSCGPATLAPLLAAPGLVDEYLLPVHPAVLSGGPRLFDGLTSDLALRLLTAKAFDGGAVVLRYAALPH